MATMTFAWSQQPGEQLAPGVVAAVLSGCGLTFGFGLGVLVSSMLGLLG